MAKPIIILVSPQMGENIGAAARAMANFGLEELRLVSPRDGWPNPKAKDVATGGAEKIIKSAKVFDNFEEAVADINFLVATSARVRDLEKEVVNSRDFSHYLLSPRMRGEAGGGKTAIMFGPERTGLSNEEIVLADLVVKIPSSEDCPSLNVAQAVAILCYEWFASNKNETFKEVSEVAPKNDVINLFQHLENELENKNFFRVPEKREKMVNNIRNMINRANFTTQEIKTLRGIIESLSKNSR